MSDKKVLVVDDDRKIVDLVKLYLERDGYKVLCAYDGREALGRARDDRPDLIVLDLLLPELNGLDVCRILRAESDVPIIMLTAKTMERDKLMGLELGADDYVTKPFSPRELAARVRAVLRRAQLEPKGPAEITAGDLTIRFPSHEVILAGDVVQLTPSEFKLLVALVREPGRAFTRLELIDEAFGYDFEGFERTIDVHIMNLRKKLESESSPLRYIKTVYGVGYRFEGE
ncbi:MAG: DNA-binding response regulator [Chloroflexi bacterium RBG_13_54_9]|nr:MAG: DNA-binding response regulator [Chloroflexi bacterium RBG_13_54_9]